MTQAFGGLRRRAGLAIAVGRPPVMVLLSMYAVTGLAAAGGDINDPLRLAPVLTAIVGFLAFSVCLNDIADLEIDRINLAGSGSRPLVTGLAHRRQLVVVAAAGASAAVGASGFIGWRALVVCAVGLAISAAYSLPPIRLAKRGVVASLLLPACYVAVPYLVGVFDAASRMEATDFALLAALYVGFIGRILLKDFRDLRGDALFGKRTFLVRHGRGATCRFSATSWVAGTVLTVFAMVSRGSITATFVLAHGVALIGVLALLCALAIDRGPRRDELIISAIAIIGRGQLLTVLVALSMAQRSTMLVSAAIGVVAVIAATQAYYMLRRGPVVRRTIPIEWLATTRSESFAEAVEVGFGLSHLDFAGRLVSGDDPSSVMSEPVVVAA